LPKFSSEVLTSPYVGERWLTEAEVPNRAKNVNVGVDGVTRKLTVSTARTSAGSANCLVLGSALVEAEAPAEAEGFA